MKLKLIPLLTFFTFGTAMADSTILDLTVNTLVEIPQGVPLNPAAPFGVVHYGSPNWQWYNVFKTNKGATSCYLGMLSFNLPENSSLQEGQNKLRVMNVGRGKGENSYSYITLYSKNGKSIIIHCFGSKTPDLSEFKEKVYTTSGLVFTNTPATPESDSHQVILD